MPKGLKRYYGNDHLDFLTLQLLSPAAMAWGSPRARPVLTYPRRGSTALPVRGGGLCCHAGTHSSIDQRAEAGQALNGDAGGRSFSIRLCSPHTLKSYKRRCQLSQLCVWRRIYSKNQSLAEGRDEDSECRFDVRSRRQHRVPTLCKKRKG